jgi:uncharacterized protein (TIGR02145 family)
MILLLSDCKKNEKNTLIPPSIVSDIDGNIYHTVTIGTQVWMVENLNVTHYSNGDTIANITSYFKWRNSKSGAYCNYKNDVKNSIDYGKLYNWYAVSDSRKIAPPGWHIPSEFEWNVLMNYLGGEKIAGGKLKETGLKHWRNTNLDVTNESGFTALPAGEIDTDGDFRGIGLYTSWWSSSETYPHIVHIRSVGSQNNEVTRNTYTFIGALSVRCIWDQSNSTP